MLVSAVFEPVAGASRGIVEAADRYRVSLIRPFPAEGGASELYSEVWLCERQCEQMAFFFALPAKQRLYSVPLIWDHLRSFVTATCLRKAWSYWAYPPYPFKIFEAFNDSGLVGLEFRNQGGVPRVLMSVAYPWSQVKMLVMGFHFFNAPELL